MRYEKKSFAHPPTPQYLMVHPLYKKFTLHDNCQKIHFHDKPYATYINS